MNRLLIVLLFLFVLAGPGWAQQSSEDMQVAEEPEATPEEEEPEFDESGLDEQGFEDQDDDFDPTEQIPTDQSIEFPTDI